MFKLRHLFIYCVLLCPASLYAAPENYAFQAQLSLAEDSLQRVVLPSRIVESLALPDYGDIAVYNADGKLMPQLVIATPDRVSEHRVELPFHQFDRFSKSRSRTVTRREQNRQDGQLSELATTEVVTIDSVRKDYLVELQPDGRRHGYDSIELDWRHQPASQVLKIRVEAGDELDRLGTLIAQKSLTNTESSDREWRSLTRVPGKQRYLRLTALNEVESFELRGVTGHYSETTPPPDLVLEITPERLGEDGVDYYQVTLPSAVRPEAMRILPAEPNSILRGDLYLKTGNSDQHSRYLRNFRQHNLAGDDIKAAAPLKLPRNRFTEIRFTATDYSGAAPSVELIYPQQELVFLGDGRGPYTLAWGNHDVTSPPPSLRGLVEVEQARVKNAITAVELLAVEEAGGVSRLRPEAVLPWKKWLLWASLIAAALIAGRMAFKLYREMNPAAQ